MSFAFMWEMAWKSAAIIAAAMLLARALRGCSPADRAAVLRLGVSLLLLLPVIALFLPALQIETAAEPAAPIAAEVWIEAESTPLEIASLQPVPASIWDDPSGLIAWVYLAGLLAVLLRIGAGLLTLRRWTREATTMTDAVWLAAFDRARPTGRVGGRVRLLVSDQADAPLSWGWLRPVVMIDRDTLERREDAAAVLAHEIAHLVRRDWPVLILTRLATALFWFNPLAWLLERELVQQAEEAADLAALGQVEPAAYAQTLVSCARHARLAPVPANSMAPAPRGLKRRVLAILDGRGTTMKSGSFWTAAAMLGCAGFAAPLAAIELVPAVAELVAAAPPAPQAPAALSTPAIAQALPARPAALASAEVAPPLPASATRSPAMPTTPDDDMIEVPAIDIDVPETRVRVPAIDMEVNGERVHVQAVDVVAPRVRVNVPPIAVRMPRIAIAAAASASAQAAAGPSGWSAEDRAEFERDMAEMRREIARETAEARAEARAEADEASRVRIAEVRREALRGVAAGASGMDRGADEMVRGARTMRQEAEKLRSPAYRERQIARARAEGRTLTHQELIDAIPKLRAGSKKLLAGADKMRASAERMRRGEN